MWKDWSASDCITPAGTAFHRITWKQQNGGAWQRSRVTPEPNCSSQRTTKMASVFQRTVSKQFTGTERLLTRATGKVAKRLTAYSAKQRALSAKARRNGTATEKGHLDVALASVLQLLPPDPRFENISLNCIKFSN